MFVCMHKCLMSSLSAPLLSDHDDGPTNPMLETYCCGLHPIVRRIYRTSLSIDRIKY